MRLAKPQGLQCFLRSANALQTHDSESMVVHAQAGLKILQEDEQGVCLL